MSAEETGRLNGVCSTSHPLCFIANRTSEQESYSKSSPLKGKLFFLKNKWLCNRPPGHVDFLLVTVGDAGKAALHAAPEGLKSSPGHHSLRITGVCFLNNFSGEFIVHPVPPCKGSSSICMSYGFVFSVSNFVLPSLLFLCQYNSVKWFQCSSVLCRCRYLCSLPHFCKRFGQYPDSHTLPWCISSL